MVMEIGGFRGTKWTSTVPHPFSPAPGAGLSGTKWTSTVPWPFASAPGAGMAELALISTKTQRDAIGPNQDPAVEVRAFVMGQTAALGPAFDQALLPALAQLGYVASAPTMKAYPLKASWVTDPNDRELFEARVINESAGPFKDETLEIKAGGPVTEADTAALPKVGTAWNVAAVPKDGVFNDGKLGILLDALRKAKQTVPTQPVQLQLRIFGVPKKVAPVPAPPPKPTPVDEEKKPITIAQAGVGVGILLVAFNLLSPHIGSRRF